MFHLMTITIQGLVPKLEATEKSEYCKEYGVLRNNMPGKKQAKRLGDVGFQCGRVPRRCIFWAIFGKPAAQSNQSPNDFSDLLAFQIEHIGTLTISTFHRPSNTFTYDLSYEENQSL